MFTVFTRAVVLFSAAVALMRLMGKRQIGQLQPFELVITIMIADLASTPMGDIGTPLLYGIVPMLVLLCMHSALTLCCMKSERLRKWIDGKPRVLISRGTLHVSELNQLGLTVSDLLEELRTGGVLNIKEVSAAVLETSGKLSVFPNAEGRPVQPKDLQLPVGYEGLPLTLVVSGVLQGENLRLAGLAESWVREKLLALGYDRYAQVVLCSLDTSGVMLVYGLGENARMQTLQALPADQVRW